MRFAYADITISIRYESNSIFIVKHTWFILFITFSFLNVISTINDNCSFFEQSKPTINLFINVIDFYFVVIVEPYYLSLKFSF